MSTSSIENRHAQTIGIGRIQQSVVQCKKARREAILLRVDHVDGLLTLKAEWRQSATGHKHMLLISSTAMSIIAFSTFSPLADGPSPVLPIRFCACSAAWPCKGGCRTRAEDRSDESIALIMQAIIGRYRTRTRSQSYTCTCSHNANNKGQRPIISKKTREGQGPLNFRRGGG